jgi:hypothetical protein
MSIVRTSTLFVGAFLSLSAMALAAAETLSPVEVFASTSLQSTHIAKGAVKFVDASTLVIQQASPYAGKSMTFVMRPSTGREGDLKVGSTVTVRYENEPDHRIATLVGVDHAKVAPHPSPSH